MVFAILLIVHTLRNQLILEYLMYPFKTLQLCYTHIIDMHVEIYFLINLQHFKLSQFWTTAHIE